METNKEPKNSLMHPWTLDLCDKDGTQSSGFKVMLSINNARSTRFPYGEKTIRQPVQHTPKLIPYRLQIQTHKLLKENVAYYFHDLEMGKVSFFGGGGGRFLIQGTYKQ